MSGFMLGSASVIAIAGALLICSPGIIIHLNGMEPQDSASARRTYRVGGLILIGLAAILIIQLLTE